MKSALLLVVLSVCTVYVVRSQDDFEQMYCGRQLASALALLCEGMPQTVLLKRSGVESQQQGTWPWLPSQSARSLHRNKRQLVVAECCDKPCSINELTNYC